ncbi:autotransporter outer membrane beta-barrel domain-containing protein [Afipia sp. GAS231]|uniref:autotransporter outer membrane beta-barrel domain-containing protein n=1 Tax=Afipia sp. GAS231 TaxID=1882747 RepID=UPI0012FB92DD|nr:autotransporter outer membrane beta-barrel domain-containing protein [Afipia sp. GAS231]
MSSGNAGALRRRVLLSGTMLVAAAVGYGRRAYGACAPSGGTTYQCSGTEVTTQPITANNAAVSTLPGFSVNSPGDGITITGDGALSYTDTNASSVTGAGGKALYVKSTGNDAGTSTPGSVTINTNGALTGGVYGIDARNAGTGALTVTVTANGDVTGTGFIGINVFNSAAGTDLSVTTGAGTTVSGAIGIEAINQGSGATTVTVNGDVTGTGGGGIVATNFALATALTVTTGAGTTVSGTNGIIANNYGTGALTITANGNVTGATGNGIYARNRNGTTLTVTTAAGTTVRGTGGGPGIFARNFGTGALTITANGDVTSTGGRGILAQNDSGTTLTVTTAAGTTVRGASYGIFAYNAGTGATTITANGNVTGTTFTGIYARNTGTGTSLSVTTAAGTTVSGTNGIYARNQGTGALTITANGDVTGTTGNGIDAHGYGTNLTVTTAAGTTVSGNTNGIFARNLGSGATTVTANGDVTGTNGNGINALNSISGPGLSVTTAAGTTVSGATNGISATNYGGAMTITANGNVTGGSGSGIAAFNAGFVTALSVTTGAGTTVSGGTDGIVARNYGSGALTITANGDVTGTSGRGIAALHGGTALSVTIGAGTTVSGGSDGIYASSFGSGTLAITVAATGTVSGGSGFGIQARGRPATVTVAGTVNGGAGGAIKFDQAGAFADRLELVTGAVINGNVLAGPGTDTLALTGTGTANFDAGLIGSGQQYQNFEAFQKDGSGTWTLTGTNTLVLPWTVAQGTLVVNANMTNAPFTVTGGVLAGTGTIGNTLVTGGIFAPGSGTAGSSMTVNGTLGFNAAATYAVHLNPTTSSFANVSGAATLGGATVNAAWANGSYIAKQYTILTAGSVSGTFNPTVANTNLPANFHDTLSYDATHAYLNLALNFTTPASGTLNANQNNVANALINSFNSNGGIPLTFATLSAPALSQASGQPGASTSQAGITGVGQFINGVFDGAFGDNPGRSGATAFAPQDDEANAYAPKRQVSREAKEAYAAVTPRDRQSSSFEQRWNVWASAYGGNSRVNGDTTAGTNTTTNRVVGAVAGATYHFTPDTQAGFALGGAGSSFDIANGFGGGRADAFNAAVYAKHSWGAAYVAGLLGYSWQDTSTDRTVTIAGIDRLHASFRAQALAARLEGGWRYATPVVGITPYAALQTTTFYLPGYGETATSGSNTFALNYTSKTVTATRSEFGAKFDKAMLVQGGVFTLKARTAWAHDWNTDRAATATFQTLPGATFAVNGAQPSANAALASLGAEMKWHNGWSAAGYFEGEFSRATAGYAAKGGVKYAW